MRMDKQGKGGGNAVDEEEKRQMRAMGEGRAFDAPGAQKMCTRPAKDTKRKHERESKCPNSAAQPATPQ